MPIALPDSVVVLGPKARAIAALLRDALPALSVLEAGAAPKGGYALIAFTPGPEIARYADADWVHIAGAGANGVLDRLTDANMSPHLITRTVGRMGQQIGEYVLSYILADTQKQALRRQLQADRNWNPVAGTPDIAADRRALIFGTGGIGGGVATSLLAIGMRVSGASRSGQARAPFDRVFRLDDLPDMTNFDVCVGALPLTSQTQGIIGIDVLSKFEGALFINVGRGATADMDAVVEALAAGRLRHAVLDVVPEEPLPPDSPLWAQPQMTLTPHVSGITLNADTVAAFTAAYRAIEAGEEPPLRVDAKAGY
ncbi:2-hydroxyacid dehydrogenase [Algimonas arctica]|uniref:2-hydroxyacid dehydrogenase n=1 Tax=Algimonas arctica TaxID=1479486 RepID=A0A8J3G359_9PROT|nr:NAD(P)-dependent oxidoreductase [Algimonas arctica]GHB00658.1 2-hydroxyacid dehydrogenase [Algimonas arctica]